MARSYFTVLFDCLLTPEIIYKLISHSVYAVNSRKMNVYFCQQWQLTLSLYLRNQPSFSNFDFSFPLHNTFLITHSRGKDILWLGGNRTAMVLRDDNYTRRAVQRDLKTIKNIVIVALMFFWSHFRSGAGHLEAGQGQDNTGHS